jgi:hypothetical protein
MKENKVSAVVGLSVTILAVVTAFAFSIASASYSKEVASLKKMNAQAQKTIEDYRVVLENIKGQLVSAGIKVQ